MKLRTSFSGLIRAENRGIELYGPEWQHLFDDRFALRLLPPTRQVSIKRRLIPGLREALLAWRESLVRWVSPATEPQLRYGNKRIDHDFTKRLH